MAIQSAGANIIHPSTIWPDQCLMYVRINKHRNYHSVPPFKKEFQSTVSILKSEGLLSDNHTQYYRLFSEELLLQSLDWTKLNSCVKEKIINLDILIIIIYITLK